ncbi:hypothetical protein P43SY_003932 [Pythium insidiosum]|uniref:PiggyBac transposable element-derived protein domain-containing protein n=1 Tax=Pythium insidiosum TaxID=114742 RepID=A0AAD5L9X6_PYTIN|nr:hypothetical protein P43SY_003932 [Pythium insidiosum]
MYTHRVSREVVEHGIKNYETLSGSTLNKATWKHICEVPSAEAMVDCDDLDDYVSKIRDPLVGRMVSYCCEKEEWMPAKLYKDVAGLFLSGRVHVAKPVKGEKRGAPSYEIRWTVTSYQSKMYTHRVSREVVEHGIKNYETLSGSTLNKATWKHIYAALLWNHDKGEYSNYWGNQAEDEIFGVNTTFGLENFMTKWHKKLALAFIDIARVNAYVTKRMVDESDKSLRNQHRQFMIDLASEPFSVDYQFTEGRIAIRRTVRLHFVEDKVSKWDARQTRMQVQL